MTFIQPPGSGPAMVQAPGAQINLNPRELDDVRCECGNYTFQEILLLKHMPALISPTGKSGFIPMKAFACVVCNQIPSGLMEGLSGWFKDGGKAPVVSADRIEGSVLPGLETITPDAEDGEDE